MANDSKLHSFNSELDESVNRYGLGADVAYLKTHMQFVDERYVKELCAQFWNVEGYPKEMTEEQTRELDNIALSEGWV